MFHIGEYKTAVNMFTQEQLTPHHKESLERLLEDIYASTLAGIAKNRNLDIDLVKKIIEESPISNQAYTGSIGVIAGKFVLKNLYDKIGIKKEIVKTSKYADMFWDNREFNQDEQDKMMTLMEHMYQLFLEVVSKSRNMNTEEVDKIARGRVWAGTSAFNLKMVEKLGGLDEAINEAKKLANWKKN